VHCCSEVRTIALVHKIESVGPNEDMCDFLICSSHCDYVQVSARAISAALERMDD
jgi:hypothetical protein